MRWQTFDLDVLRSFVFGVELGSFAKASERLGRSTSAVSAQLKKLESQVELPILRKSGRGLVLTPAGELLFSYARRLLELNDEATAALCTPHLEGCIRVGLPEDFGEHLLTDTLGSFARSHPRVQIEATVGHTAQLLELVSSGRLDLALAWNTGITTPHCKVVARLPMCWIGGEDRVHDTPQPLATVESPCLMRSAAIKALDCAGIAWRVAFTSSSLSGVWAAVSAGLGVTVRTRVGMPQELRVLDGLPALPRIALILHRADAKPAAHIKQLEAILLERLENLISAL